MNRSTLLPMIVDIVAHVLDQFGNQVRADWLMSASLDSDTARTIVPRIGADSRESLTLQPEDQRRAELKRTSLQCCVNSADRRVILPKAVSSLGGGFLLRIGNKLRFERAAISPFALITCHF